MIRKDGKNIERLRVGKKEIAILRKGKKTIWEGDQCCFGRRGWRGDKPWIGTNAWQ